MKKAIASKRDLIVFDVLKVLIARPAMSFERELKSDRTTRSGDLELVELNNSTLLADAIVR